MDKSQNKPATDEQRVEWFDDRYYRVLAEKGEEFYPSVTTILGIINKPFLSRWRGDVGNYEADRRMNFAAWRGSRIHDAIHRLLSIGEDKKPLTVEYGGIGDVPYTQEEWLHVCRFVDWYKLFRPEVLYSELIVLEHVNRYAGTCDFICRLKAGDYPIGTRTVITVPADGLYVGDLKTGKEVDEEYTFQTAAYANAAQGMGLGDIKGTFILHTASTNKAGFAVHLHDEWSDDFKMFLHASELWRRKNPNGTPKVFSMPSSFNLSEV